ASPAGGLARGIDRAAVRVAGGQGADVHAPRAAAGVLAGVAAAATITQRRRVGFAAVVDVAVAVQGVRRTAGDRPDAALAGVAHPRVGGLARQASILSIDEAIAVIVGAVAHLVGGWVDAGGQRLRRAVVLAVPARGDPTGTRLNAGERGRGGRPEAVAVAVLIKRRLQMIGVRIEVADQTIAVPIVAAAVLLLWPHRPHAGPPNARGALAGARLANPFAVLRVLTAEGRVAHRAAAAGVRLPVAVGVRAVAGIGRPRLDARIGVVAIVGWQRVDGAVDPAVRRTATRARRRCRARRRALRVRRVE